MLLAFCTACCHVYNVVFDPELVIYDARYDNTLHHSPTFQSYTTWLVEHLIRDANPRPEHIVEIGSGKGHFLVELCRGWNCRGTGYDPSYDDEVSDPRVVFVKRYMPWDEAHDFDFFVSRQVLEHQVEPIEFLAGLRRACGRRSVAGYIEVPDAIYDFERSPWNCHYPHVSYFSATSLARLAIRAGFGILRVVRNFEGQYLALEMGVNVSTPDQIDFGGMGLHREREILADFRGRLPTIVEGWRRFIEAVGPDRCAVWGAGAKSLGLLNAVDPEASLRGVVDLNDRKWGRYLPVTGHRIVSPADLPKDVEAVLITNPVYRDEIAAHLVELGVSAEVFVAHTPSDAPLPA
jgi:hypothetical protein